MDIHLPCIKHTHRLTHHLPEATLILMGTHSNMVSITHLRVQHQRDLHTCILLTQGMRLNLATCRLLMHIIIPTTRHQDMVGQSMQQHRLQQDQVGPQVQNQYLQVLLNLKQSQVVQKKGKRHKTFPHRPIKAPKYNDMILTYT